MSEHVSLLPSDAVEGAGLPLDDADVIIESALFAMWNYNGTQADGPALRVTFVDGEDKKHEQYYSAGKAEKSVPSEDGKKLLPTSAEGPKGLNKSTKAYAFLASLFNADPAGIGALLADGEIDKLNGLRAHVIAVADKDKDGATVKNAKGYDRVTIVVSKVIALPGQKPKAAAAGAKPAGTKAAAAPAAAAVNADQDNQAAELLVGIVAEAGGSVARAKVSTLMFQAANKAKLTNKSQLTTRVFQEDFLKSRSEFAYDGTNISLAA